MTNVEKTGQTRPGVHGKVAEVGRVDVEAITTRYTAAMESIATGGGAVGSRTAATGNRATAGNRATVAVLVVAVADVPVLIDEVRALRLALRAARLRAANLEAAARATLGAVGDGERDPLFYLRDELGVTP